jgi:hypothetical protein
MTYVMQKDLVDYILAQHAEADEFSKTPGNYMGKMPAPENTAYWSQRVSSGTLAEFKRTELEETAYYITADKTSKSYARSLDFEAWTDEKIEAHIERMCA